jgi:ubiquinone/menaquinone biosynthesis C-methylase UbiE
MEKLGGAALSWRALEPLLRGRSSHTPLRLLDVGTGAADIPRYLARRARAKGYDMEITATDVRPEIVALARERTTDPALEVRLDRPEAIGAPDASYDVVHASLLVHHLEPGTAAGLLAEMRRVARTAVIVNDLERRTVWLAFAMLLTLAGTRNRYTRNDAPLSVRRAYSLDELTALAARAGLRPAATYRTVPHHRHALVLVHGRG